MKSDIHVQDPRNAPICPKVAPEPYIFKGPSRFRRKKQIEKVPVSKYNGNFKSMPKDF